MALRLICLWFVALLALPTPPLHAQDYFQSLFGNSPSPRPYSHPHRYPGAPPYRSTYGFFPFSPFQPDRTEDVQPHQRGGTVRTLCVRLCDGFYFPISNAATRAELSRDADKCSAACSADARLFYYSNADGSPETMVDLTGRAYSSLPNAFRYRKMLVKGCLCRPQPWSEAELQRHRSYGGQLAVADATAALAADGESAASQPLVASAIDHAPSRPEPIDRAMLEQLDPAAAPPRVAGAEGAGVTVITNERLVPRPQPVVRQMPAPPLSWYSGSNPWGTSPYIWSGEHPRRAR